MTPHLRRSIFLLALQGLMLLASLLLPTPGVAADTTRVLMLVSYHPGMAWSDAQIAGVRAELDGMQPPIDLQLEFLDTKRVAPSERYYGQLEALLLTKIGSLPPAVILVADDDALDLALRMRQKHFKRVPILFSGVAISRRQALEQEENIGGVFDDIDVGDSLTLTLRALPKTRKLVVIHDQSRTSLAQVATVREVLQHTPNLQVEYLTNLSAEAIQGRLGVLDAHDLVFALPFNRDARGTIFTHEEAADLWADASTAPVTVTRDVAMRPGILGGFLVSGLEQGQTVGRMTRLLMSGIIGTPLPLESSRSHATFDYLQMQRWGMDSQRLPPDATILNLPPKPMDGLRPHMEWLLALFGSLLVIIGLLLYGTYSRKRTSRAMRESERKYRELFDHSPDAMTVRDAHTGELLETNPRFQSLFGYTTHEARQLQTADLCAPGARATEEQVRERMDTVLRDGYCAFEWHQRRKDGSTFWAEISMMRVEIAERTCTLSTVRDISDRKLAEQLARDMEHRIRQIYENLPIAVFAIDAEHRVTFWNPQMTRLTGVPAEEVVGTTDSWKGIYPTPRPCLLDVLVDGANADDLERYYPGRLRRSAVVAGALEGEDYFTNMDKSKGMWGRYCAAPLRDANGQITGAIETLIDVTQLKSIQTNLEDLNRDLEARVEARNQELQRAMSQLVQSEKLAALGSLVAGVAHELNTPIGNVMAVASTLTEETVQFSEKLLSGAARRSDVEKGAKRLSEASLLIERNASRAAKLINDFKEIAVDQSSTRRRLFGLRAVVEEVLHTTQPIFKGRGVQIDIDIASDLALDSYPGPLEQVLTNFLTNSVHHGFDGRDTGHILIRATLAGERVQLDYEDNGCGIPAASLPHIFEPFYTTKLGRGGSGLGMYIVYNLVHNVLSGSITAHSVRGQGTRMALDLPRVAPITVQAP